MSKPIPTILERVKEMTRQALEREAEKLLALDVVKDAISEAAKQGFSRLTIAPDRPIDLSKTTVALATIDILKGEGFGIEWEKRQHPDGRALQAFIIRWGDVGQQ